MKPFNILSRLLAVSVAAMAVTAAAQVCPPGNPRVAPDSRYIDHGDGTVTDRQTYLMWKRCSEGQIGNDCGGTASLQTWEVGLATAVNSSFAGYSDWRLPNAKELQSLVETGCHFPAINTTRFPNTPGVKYLTSTTMALITSNVSYVNFNDGNLGNDGKSRDFGVRLVRAGR